MPPLTRAACSVLAKDKSCTAKCFVEAARRAPHLLTLEEEGFAALGGAQPLKKTRFKDVATRIINEARVRKAAEAMSGGSGAGGSAGLAGERRDERSSGGQGKRDTGYKSLYSVVKGIMQLKGSSSDRHHDADETGVTPMHYFMAR